MDISEEDRMLPELGRVLATFQNRSETHGVPPLLYHFTDAAGAVGIVRSKELWASRAMSLNDSSEVHYGWDRCKGYLQKRLDAEQLTLMKRFLEFTMSFLDDPRANPEISIPGEPFVVSFCGEKDQSSHWLHYGRAGRGYALGCVPGELTKSPCSLIKMIYDHSEQEIFIGDEIRRLEEIVHGFASKTQDAGALERVARMAGSLCSGLVSSIATYLKHPAFESEQEWRLVSNGYFRNANEVPLRMGYRISDSRIIPYIILEYSDGVPISEVVLGSCVDVIAAKGALGYLFGNRIDALSIGQSAVPVR